MQSGHNAQGGDGYWNDTVGQKCRTAHWNTNTKPHRHCSVLRGWYLFTRYVLYNTTKINEHNQDLVYRWLWQKSDTPYSGNCYLTVASWFFSFRILITIFSESSDIMSKILFHNYLYFSKILCKSILQNITYMLKSKEMHYVDLYKCTKLFVGIQNFLKLRLCQF